MHISIHHIHELRSLLDLLRENHSGLGKGVSKTCQPFLEDSHGNARISLSKDILCHRHNSISKWTK